MEEQREFKHVCKFCSKSFPCGRSLGGHMRSHMINDISAQSDGTKLTKKKLPPLNTINKANNNINNNNNNNNSAETIGYGLRENPKKTWRLKDHSSDQDNSLIDKLCKECGKVFQSWKALFAHMKCHSIEKDKVSNNNNSLEEQQDSWTSANNNQKQVMDSQSDNETAAPNRKKRSKRRIMRYMGTANSSSVSFVNNNNNNNASSSVSHEIEQEQEEVAMCLMMLSRDVGGGQWCGLNSVAESSDNNSVFLEANRFSFKNEGKNSACDGSEIDKVKQVSDKKSEICKLEPEDFKVEAQKTEFPASVTVKNDRVQNSEDALRKSLVKENGLDEGEKTVANRCNSSKRKFQSCFNTEVRPESLKKPTMNALDSERSIKFECATCNKVFHSHQALGGHRASHKKIKGCFATRIDNSENSIDTNQVSPDHPTADSSSHIKSITNEIPIYHHLATEYDNNKSETSYGAKKSKGHECPICLKVFPSGQALGGHKRSHLVGDIVAKNSQTITMQDKPMPAIRDFLDLNLPAPVEEESNGLAGCDPWWTASSHKHETFVGLISN